MRTWVWNELKLVHMYECTYICTYLGKLMERLKSKLLTSKEAVVDIHFYLLYLIKT